MGNKPKPRQLEWERIPNEYKRQLHALVARDHHHALKEGRASLEDAVEGIKYALEEVANLFRQSTSKALQWLEDEKNAAFVCYSVEYRRFIKGNATHVEIATGHGDNRGEAVFVWKGRDISPHPEVCTSNELLPGGPPPKERWLHWTNWRTAVYFFHNRVDNMKELPDRVFGLITFDTLLVTSLPTVEDQTERAVRYAKELTAPGAERREDYRLRKYVEGGPNLPVRLTEKVGYYLGVGPRRAAEILENGGFELPDDLGAVKKPKSKK